MTARRTYAIGRSLDTLFRVGTLGSASDGELLECLSSEQNSDAEEAFRVLVERHGPMVLGLCRSLVKDAHIAEDAFQATFLVLIRKANSIRRRDTLGPWLHGVAAKVARRARARSARRSRIERPLPDELTARDDPSADCAMNSSIVQEEIARLPEPLRGPLLLCCIQRMSYDGAARSLGVTEPTLRGRLHRARKRLAARLSARGIHASALGASLEPIGFFQPSLSPALVESTVHISVRWTSISGLSAGALAVPDSIATLAQGVISMLTFQAYKTTAAGLLVGASLLGTIVLAQQATKRVEDPGSTSQTVARGKSTENDPQGKAAHSPTKRAEEAPKSVQLDAKTRQIRERLQQMIELSRSDLPLDELLKYIKQSTTDEAFPGIPIYVDPVGLQQADGNLAVQVTVPRKGSVDFVLSSALHQVHLSYLVKDGFLMISSREDITERKLNDLDEKVERVLRMLERLEKAKM